MFCPSCGARAAASSAVAAGERRVVSVVFADVVGFTRLLEERDPEVVTDAMSRLFDRMGAVVARYGGSVDKLIGDAAMMVFGAPAAHEDDPERAVLTALECVALMPALDAELAALHGARLGLELHVGVATGLVVAGVVGRAAGGGYTVMGDAVNVAARLVELAGPGEVLVADETARLARGRVRTQLLGEQTVKGRSGPVRVHRVTGARQTIGEARGLLHLASALVGRDLELATLDDALGVLARGAGARVWLEGPPGVGKSRLFRECVQRLDDRGGARVLVGRSASYGQQVPYLPWRPVVRRLLEAGRDAELPARAREVLEGLAGWSEDDASPAQAAGRRDALEQGLAALVAHVAVAQPLVLCIDDLHWADAPSLALFAALGPLAERVPLALVGISRHAQELTDAALLGPGTLRLQLAPLGPAATRSLVERLLADVAGTDERLIAEVAARCEGIPLYAEEILRHWIEAGVLQPELGGWRLAPDRARTLALPTSLQALLSARVDRLPTPERARLEVASLLGREFDPALVDLLVAVEGGDAWARLEARGDLVATGARLRFGNALLQEALAASLLRSRRQAIHLHAAETLLRQGAAAHVLAHHFDEAGRPAEAAPHWLVAARQAAALYANDEALELYARVLRTRPPPALAVAALCGRGTLLGVRGQLAEAAAELDRAIALCQQLGDDSALADALSRAAYVAYVSGDGPGILTRAEAAMRAAERSGEVRPRIAALRQLGIAHEFAGRFAAAESVYQTLLALDPARGDEASAGALNSLGEIARAQGKFAEATFLYRQCGVVAEALGLLRTTLVARANLGAALAESGEPAEALTVLDDAARELARRGYHAFHAENRYYHALASLALGDADGACRDAEEARRAAEQNGEAEMLGLCLRLEARLCEAGVRTGDAERCLEESIETFARIGKPGEEARSRAALAGWLFRRGRADAARVEAGRARPVLLAMGRADLAGALDAIG